nr:hypothetical protein [uncultured Paludibaculum sp.]
MIEESRRSGQGPTEFCRARGLDVAQFYYWRRVLAREDQEEHTTGQFVLLGQDISLHAGDEDSALELETADGWHLRIRPGVDKETLRLVIDVLRPKA